MILLGTHFDTLLAFWKLPNYVEAVRRASADSHPVPQEALMSALDYATWVLNALVGKVPESARKRIVVFPTLAQLSPRELWLHDILRFIALWPPRVGNRPLTRDKSVTMEGGVMPRMRCWRPHVRADGVLWMQYRGARYQAAVMLLLIRRQDAMFARIPLDVIKMIVEYVPAFSMMDDSPIMAVLNGNIAAADELESLDL